MPPSRPSKTRSRRWPQQALANAAVISDDVLESLSSIIAEIDKKLTEQINLIIHHEEYQQLESAWRGLSSPGQQYRDRRDAEDPGDVHLQEGAAQDPAQVQGHRLGPVADLQEAL